MDRRDNLRQFDTMSPEEHRELSRRGGVASGESRRYWADFRMQLLEALAEIDLARDIQQDYKDAVKKVLEEERKKYRRSQGHGKDK